MTTAVTTTITNHIEQYLGTRAEYLLSFRNPKIPRSRLNLRGLMSLTESTRLRTETARMGRIGLIDSGCASGQNDFADAIAAAIINKRAGGTGLIIGHRIFQRPMHEGVQPLNLIKDVYLSGEVVCRNVSCRYEFAV